MLLKGGKAGRWKAVTSLAWFPLKLVFVPWETALEIAIKFVLLPFLPNFQRSIFNGY